MAVPATGVWELFTAWAASECVELGDVGLGWHVASDVGLVLEVIVEGLWLHVSSFEITAR